MQSATQYSHSGDARDSGGHSDFIPLILEARTHVTTAVMCQHLGRKPQTARGWACHENYPEGLRPVRVMGRLAWPVAGIRSLLGVPA